MEKEDIIKITTKLYKTTLLFPKKEPLRYKAREVADDILKNLITIDSLNSPNPGSFAKVSQLQYKELIFMLEKDLEVLNSYFEIAKYQNWSYFDTFELQQEYGKIGQQLKTEISKIEVQNKENELGNPYFKSQELPFKKTESESKVSVLQENGQKRFEEKGLGERKERILKILKEKERLQVGDLKKVFPDFSKRTIRRDFHDLLKKGLIQRRGERNNTFYYLRD